MALTVAAASAQAMGAALATDIGSGAIIEIRSTMPLIRLSNSPETEIEAAEIIEVWR